MLACALASFPNIAISERGRLYASRAFEHSACAPWISMGTGLFSAPMEIQGKLW